MYLLDKTGRGEKIRTSGPCLPKAVLYQAELHPEPRAIIHTDTIVSQKSNARWAFFADSSLETRFVWFATTISPACWRFVQGVPPLRVRMCKWGNTLLVISG